MNPLLASYAASLAAYQGTWAVRGTHVNRDRVTDKKASRPTNPIYDPDGTRHVDPEQGVTFEIYM